MLPALLQASSRDGREQEVREEKEGSGKGVPML